MSFLSALNHPIRKFVLSSFCVLSYLASESAIRDFSLEQATGRKGITIIEDLEDALLLGAEYTTVNISLGSLLDAPRGNGILMELAGHTFEFNKGYVHKLDEEITTLTEAGIEVTGVLLNIVKNLSDAESSPLLHPSTDLENTPLGFGAFNTRTAEGRAYLEAACEFLIERYTRPGAPYGWMTGLVVGNEVSSHWVWHNQGLASDEAVIVDYEKALRIASVVAKRIHSHFRIYLSAEHNWNQRGFTGDAQKELPARTLIEGIHRVGIDNGDFEWHVAFHPYPENMFDPAVWNDRKATFYKDARILSFKNLEVLCDFVGQDKFHLDGKRRRILLSEQGFHAPNSKKGEIEQAAGLVYAFKKVELLPEIDALIVHRHIDHPNEGGMRLGLRAYPTDEKIYRAGAMGEARKSWDVFKAAGGGDQQSEFAFARDVMGDEAWESLKIRHSVGEMQPAAKVENEGILFDFTAKLSEAEISNAVAFRKDEIVMAGGWLAPAIFHHPPKRGVTSAVWELSEAMIAKLPLRLEFGTALKSKDSPDGVEYRILVNGEPAFVHRHNATEIEWHSVEIESFGKKAVSITFIVDPLAGFDFDWALWAYPKLSEM